MDRCHHGRPFMNGEGARHRESTGAEGELNEDTREARLEANLYIYRERERDGYIDCFHIVLGAVQLPKMSNRVTPHVSVLKGAY